jgi:quercetin dioxygenase-like cupin family protein
MKPTSLENAPKVAFDLDGRIMHSSEKLELVHLTLKPGEILHKHKNPADVVFYILEGKGILIYEDHKIETAKDSCISLKHNIERGWENNGSENLRILVIKQLQ